MSDVGEGLRDGFLGDPLVVVCLEVGPYLGGWMDARTCFHARRAQWWQSGQRAKALEHGGRIFFFRQMNNPAVGLVITCVTEITEP